MNDWEAFLAKTAVDAGKYAGMSRRERLRAFSVTCQASVAQLEGVRDALGAVYRRGGTFHDFRKAVREGSIPGVGSLPDYRLENVFRTNVMGAYGRGRYLEQQETADVFPYLMYDAVDDSATRPNHRALDGLIVEAGSAEANRIYPPNGFQCRCTMRALTRRQAEARGIPSREAVKALIDANPPDNGWEGPPFDGTPPDLSDPNPPPPPPTEESLAESGVSVVPDSEFLDVLESGEGDVSGLVPESMLAPAKRAEEAAAGWLFSDTKKPVLTPGERKASAALRGEIADALRKEGVIGPSEDLDGGLKRLMLGLYADLNANKAGAGWGYTPEERLRYHLDQLRIAEGLEARGWTTGDPFVKDALASAEALKFLGEGELLVLNTHTATGYYYIADVLRKGTGTPEERERVRRYVKAQGLISAALDRRVSGPAVQLFRGTSTFVRDDTGRTLGDFLGAGAEGKVLMTRTPTSFSASRTVAGSFVSYFGDEDSVELTVKTARGTPVSSVSMKPQEMERIIPVGGKFRIDRVTPPVKAKRGRFKRGWKVEMTWISDDVKPDITLSVS
jgi:SPP1 gp7 family putative phage head morphogenesis protein